MFDRFTDRARKVMGLSRQEALRFNHDYIGTEHILLGLILEGGGVAADVLKNLDVDPKRIRQEVERLITPGTATVTMGRLPFTKRAKKTLELSLEEASGLGHDYIGAEHLLLGLIREEEGIAAKALAAAGVRVEDVRKHLPPGSPTEKPAAPARPAQRAFFGCFTERVRKIMGLAPPKAPAPSGGFFDRFTDRARKVMGLARQEALRFHHDYIGTEHVMLGLILEGYGVSADVLKNLDIDPKRVRLETERLMTPGTTMVTTGQLPFTPAAKRVLELTREAAIGLGHDYMGAEHLLLGLLREEKGTAARVLAGLGVTYEAARREIVELLGPPGPPG